MFPNRALPILRSFVTVDVKLNKVGMYETDMKLVQRRLNYVPHIDKLITNEI
jgi:hypothetical protein